MVYNTSVLITVEDCDKCLQEANTKRSDLIYRKTQLERALSKEETIVELLPSLLASANQNVDRLQADHDLLAPGPEKDRAYAALLDAMSERQDLVVRSNDHNGFEHMGVQAALGDIEKRIEGKDELIAVVTARKQEFILPSA